MKNSNLAAAINLDAAAMLKDLEEEEAEEEDEEEYSLAEAFPLGYGGGNCEGRGNPFCGNH